MRVTFVCGVLDYSGGSRIIATYARMLAADGHDVTVIAPLRRPLSWRRRLRTLWRTGEWEREYRGSHFDGLGLDVRESPRKPVRDEDVPDADIVVATWWETAEWVNALSERKGKKVYLVQGHEVFESMPLDRVRATYRMPMHKIVVSGWLKDIMEQTYGQHDCVLIPNSFERATFQAEPRDKQAVPTVGFMFARGAVKGSDLAIQAISRLKQSLPELRVLCFGTQPARGLEHLGRDFQFCLLPNAEQLRAAYTSCDVWLSASRSEGFGLTALEAMACRTPVVSSRVGWPLDAIKEGVNGYLVPVGDAGALHDAALKCLTLDARAWRHMSEQAHATAHACTWDKSYRLLVATLECLLEPAPAGA
jgi:glycosyltransferase involved in cell wall biosynthesis